MNFDYCISQVMPSISGNAWKVLCYLSVHPTASYRALAGALDMCINTAQAAVKALLDRELVTAGESGAWDAPTYTLRADLLSVSKNDTRDAMPVSKNNTDSTPAPVSKIDTLIGISIKPKEGESIGDSTTTPTSAQFHQGHPPPPLASSTGNVAAVASALQHPTVKKVQAAFGVNLRPDQILQLAQCDEQDAVDATIADFRQNTKWRRDNTQVFYERYLRNRDAIEAARPQPKAPRPWELEPAPEAKKIATPEERRAATARALANHPMFARLAMVDEAVTP